MSDIGLSLNENPDDISEYPGAAAVGSPPMSLTGAMADYVSRPTPAPNSLSMLMDDQQIADAGIGKGGKPIAVSLSAPAAREDGRPSTKGIGEAAEGTAIAAAGSHGLGYWTGRAAKAAKDAPMLKGLEHLNNLYAYPLTGVDGIARTVDEIHKGAPAGEAVLGNTLRTGLVMGATLLGDAAVPIVGGAVLGGLANHYLPNGNVMGRQTVKNLSDPEQTRAMLSSMQ